MEIIYIVALFIAPGMVVKELKNYFIKEKAIKQNNTYNYLFNIILDSFIIGAAVIIVMNVWFHLRIYTIGGLFAVLSSLNWMMLYAIIALVFAILWCIVKNTVFAAALFWIKNKILKRATNSTHGKYMTIWDDMINADGVRNTWMIASVYKDGSYVTSGMIAGYSSSDMEQLELNLEHKEKVEELKARHPELFQFDCEYYNTVTGLRIIFYDQELLESHWKEYFPY